MRKIFYHGVFAVFVISNFVLSVANGADYIWVEGESTEAVNVEADLSGRGSKQFLSGGAWLEISIAGGDLKEVPEGGAIVKYNINAETEDNYELWIRLGYDFLRSRFEWRMDGGEWTAVEPEELTLNPVEIAPWCPVAWLKLDSIQLSQGEHTLEFRNYADRQGKRIRFALDAICLYPGEFRPNAWYRPDDDSWKDEDAAAAAGTVFEIPESPGDGQRQSTLLSGLWQVGRYDEEGLIQDRTKPIASVPPADELRWTSLKVPGDRNALRPDLTMARRFFYRTRVHVPESHEGRRLLLHFESTSLMATVFVNGKQCGFNDLPFVPWDCDITDAVQYGEENEVWVGIKDWGYAYSEKISGQNARFFFNQPAVMSGGAPVDYVFRTIGGHRTGIIEKVALQSVGEVYVDDVFCKPSFRNKTLELEITLKNTTDEQQTVTLQNRVEPLEGGEAEKIFDEQVVTMAAGETKVLTLSEEWENPRLWWADDPFQYNVHTRVQTGDVSTDEKQTKFGFREWWIDGDQFYMNGIKQRLHSDLVHYGFSDRDLKKGTTVDDVFATWKQNGQNMFRFRFQPYWGGMDDGEALDEFDKHGIHVRREIARLDGQVFNTAIWYTDPETGEKGVNEDLMRNWRRQAQARVRAERNHPSIFIWESDNESIMLWGMSKAIREGVTPAWYQTAEAVRDVDPTRSIVTGGGVALNDDSYPTYGVHYFCVDFREYPDEAYSLEKSRDNAVKRRGFPITLGTKPIFMSEEFYAPGKPDALFATVAGEKVFTGRKGVKEGWDILAGMFSQAYRWGEVGAWHFWGTFGERCYQSWQPVACFSRRWNWSLAEGKKYEREFGVFNETRFDEPIEVSIDLATASETIFSDNRKVKVAPGAYETFKVNFELPKVDVRTPANLTIVCSREGKEVYRDDKEVYILNTDTEIPSMDGKRLIVFDPNGEAIWRLNALDVDFAMAQSLEELPGDFDVLLIGRNALTPETAKSQTFMRLAASGKRVVVLEQENPIPASSLPADLEPTDYTGRIAFGENVTHPVMDGLDQPDLFTWEGADQMDHVVYRKVYRKATRGAVSLVQCDEGLAYTAMALCPVNDGMILLSQMAVGEKVTYEPAAQRLFDNMVAYAVDYSLPDRSVGVLLDDPLKRSILDNIGLNFSTGDNAVEMIESGKYEILVIEATPANLQALAGAKDAVNAFTARGNWLMLWGLTPEGLDAYNKLVGLDHLIRPFRLEKVIKTSGDPLMAGVPASTLQLMTTQKFHSHTGQTFRDWNLFSYVLDYDDVAPFAKFPAPSYFGADNEPDDYFNAWDNLPMNMVNNLTTDDYWTYGFSIHLYDNDPTKWELQLPREETITQFSIIVNRIYHEVTRIRLTFDGKPDTQIMLDLTDEAGRQDFDIPEVKASRIGIEILDWQTRGNRDVIGINNIWITGKRDEDFRKAVIPLVNVGGIMKYPNGEGGIVLNQIKPMEREFMAENAEKKRILVAALLRNMGAGFTSSRVILPGMDLAYDPVMMKDYVNLFLDNDHNWPDPQADMRDLPLGRQVIKGVEYDIYEYTTALYPHAVTLKGVVQKSDKDVELPEKVEGMKIARKADALFFLHTYLEKQEWKRPKKNKTAKPPVVFQYVVNYVDGQHQIVPVRLQQDVDVWLQRDQKDLSNARLMWDRRVKGAESAAVWQMVWSNPRPDVEIKSIDLQYPTGGFKWGSPVLLGITAAIER